MRQISEGIYGLLVSRGIANAKPVGAGKVRGKVAQPIGVGAAVKGAGTEAPAKSNREVGRPNPAGEKPRGFAFQVHVNPDVPNASTRKRTTQVPFLVVV